MINKIKIAIADDHQIMIDGLKSIIGKEEELELVFEANDGKMLLKLLEKNKLDMIILDIDMPEMNGLEATVAIKKQYPDIKILILSMYQEKALIEKALLNGVDGYVLKNTDQEKLVKAIRDVSLGKKYLSGRIKEILKNDHNVEPKAPLIRNELLNTLTERELEVLKQIAQGYSNKEIGTRLEISHRTVDTHRTNVMQKLNIHNIANLIKVAFENGLIR